MQHLFTKTVILFGTLVMTLFAVAMLNKISAFTLSPSSGTITNGQSQAIQILGAPTGTPTAVNIELTITGGTVTSFTDAAGTLVLPSCTGDVKYLANAVCVSVAMTSGTIDSGELLGTFTVQGTGSTITIAAAAGSAYDDDQAISGTLATFSPTGGSTGGTLPNTSFENSNPGTLILGVNLILIGLFLFVGIKFFNRKTNNYVAVKDSFWD